MKIKIKVPSWLGKEKKIVKPKKSTLSLINSLDHYEEPSIWERLPIAKIIAFIAVGVVGFFIFNNMATTVSESLANVTASNVSNSSISSNQLVSSGLSFVPIIFAVGFGGIAIYFLSKTFGGYNDY